MDKINFEDLPSTNTPINATNLNQVQTNVENEFSTVNGSISSINSSISAINSKVDNFNCFKFEGNIAEGSSVDSPDFSGFFGLVFIRVMTGGYEKYYVASIMGANKYAKNVAVINEYEYKGDSSKGCTVGVYDTSSTEGIHVGIGNNGSGTLSYVMAFLSFM